MMKQHQTIKIYRDGKPDYKYMLANRTKQIASKAYYTLNYVLENNKWPNEQSE